MIVVRNVFRLKFGKAREARAALKPVADKATEKGYGPTRLMFDLVGPFYTVVMESTYDSLSSYENAGRKTMEDEEWRELYGRFSPLVESGYREIFTVMD